MKLLMPKVGEMWITHDGTLVQVVEIDTSVKDNFPLRGRVSGFGGLVQHRQWTLTGTYHYKSVIQHNLDFVRKLYQTRATPTGIKLIVV